jgi:CRP-like cAMP-binding protein
MPDSAGGSNGIAPANAPCRAAGSAAPSAPGDRLFTVLEGVLMRSRLLEDGRRQVVNIMFPGDLVGLQAAFDGEMGHGVTALTDTRLCLFPRDRFMELVTDQPRCL